MFAAKPDHFSLPAIVKYSQTFRLYLLILFLSDALDRNHYGVIAIISQKGSAAFTRTPAKEM
jgi:hypothetical protein